MMNAAEIAATVGGARRFGAWWRCVCPVHGSRTGRSATLALRDGDRGLIVHCHAGCRPRDVLAELRRGGLLARAVSDRQTPIPTRIDAADDTTRRIVAARRIWDAAADARGSPVGRYLAGRCITIAPPSSLRWAPLLRHPDGTHASSMVARVDGLDGEMIGVHRTWLARDGCGEWHRRDRASLGAVGGAAVRLALATETLMIGEGIETCLAAMQATSMPAWAALSTSGLAALLLPRSVRTVIVLADHDRSGAGERAARAGAQRWLAEGRRVRIAMPPEPGTDFADVLVGHAFGRSAEVCDVAA